MVDIIIKFLASNFAVLSGMVYILLKIFVKIGIHRLAKTTSPIDNWSMYIWTNVDLGILAASISITMHYPEKVNYNYQQSVVWYLFVTFSIIISTIFYGLFLKRRQILNGISPLKNMQLFGNMFFCTFFGVTPFIETISKLKV